MKRVCEGRKSEGFSTDEAFECVSLLYVTIHVVMHANYKMKECAAENCAVAAGRQYMKQWEEVNSCEYKDESLKSHPRL